MLYIYRWFVHSIYTDFSVLKNKKESLFWMNLIQISNYWTESFQPQITSALWYLNYSSLLIFYLNYVFDEKDIDKLTKIDLITAT